MMYLQDASQADVWITEEITPRFMVSREEDIPLSTAALEHIINQTIRHIMRSLPQSTLQTFTQALSHNVTIYDDVTSTTPVESTAHASPGPITWDDATWILTSAFIIFTMQSGFGLLEAGCVSAKNEVNIMVKNAVDVVFGGLSYWMFGYGLSFGEDRYANWFVGYGSFFVDSSSDEEAMGLVYSTYIFQLSFATTATTIVSGAMAERTKLTAYIVYSLCNTIVYSIPAHWVWSTFGFLYKMGALDIAGASAVHLVGGVSGLVATLMLKPRKGRYEAIRADEFDGGNMTNALVGMFMLWWGWLGFNCGSTFGISGGKWKLAAKSAVTTINASIGGGVMGLILTYIVNGRKYIVPELVNAVLGALVSITAGCALMRPWESVVIGMVGGAVSMVGVRLFDKLKIDDPVGAITVHGLCGLWGMLSVGLFTEEEPIENLNRGRLGAFKGGGFYLLGIQTLACTLIIMWSASTSFVLLYAIDKSFGLRMSEYEESVGADYAEHGIGKDPEMASLEQGVSIATRPKSGTWPHYGNRRSSFGFVRRASTTLPTIASLETSGGTAASGFKNSAISSVYPGVLSSSAVTIDTIAEQDSDM